MAATGPSAATSGVIKGEACPGCGQPPDTGRFGWGGGAPQAHPERCPVCERVIDHFPAGCVELSGQTFTAKRAEVLRRILQCAEAHATRHPDERIKRMDAQVGDHVEIATTHARLARRIGDFLQQQFGGQLAYRYQHVPELLRVSWRGEP